MHDRVTQRNSVRRLVAAGTIAFAVLFTATRPAAADVYTEAPGDAGDLPGTARITPLFVGPLDTIVGTIGTPADADMYRITLPTGGILMATTVGQPGTLFDTQLFLFDSGGFGLAANDEAGPVGSGRSTLVTPGVLAAGDYYLAISSFNVNPVVPGGLLIFPEPSGIGATVGPTGPGGDLAITGWAGTGFSQGTYQIALSVVPGGEEVIPEPTSFALFGLGAVGAAGYWWLRRKQAPRA